MNAAVEADVQRPLSPQQLETEVRKFESYKASIETNIQQLEKRHQRLKEDLDGYAELVQNVNRLIRDGIGTFESRVDLGCDVSCAARVPDTRRVFVSIGLGFHVEAPLEEVAGLVRSRQQHLAEQLEEVEGKIGDAKATSEAFESSLRLLKIGGQARVAA